MMKSSDMKQPVATANAHTDKASIPNLDGIRALACLLVVISHIPLPISSRTLGEIGVGVFFVLSGFLMSYLYGFAAWDFKAVCRYSIARFSRIAPIYWLVVSICILISYLQPNDEFDLKILGVTSIIRHYLFAGNVSIFWSIPLEVQYYIFFLVVWWGIAYREKLAYALPLTVLLCSGLLLTHNLWPGLALPGKLHFFLAGTIAGLMPRGRWHTVSDRNMLLLLQITALMTIASPLWLFPTIPAFYGATALAFALAVAIYLLSIPSRWTNFAFASPVMRRIGQASFSIYLIHTLVFHYGARWFELSHEIYNPLWILLGLAGVVLPMIASRYVEIPLQRVTRRFLESRLLVTVSGRNINRNLALTTTPSKTTIK